MRERKKRKEKRRQKNASFFLSFFFKNKGEGEPHSEKKKTRKKHRGSRVVFRRTDASERFIQSAKKEGKMRRVLGCGEILALELYASRLSLFGANKKFWTFELPWPYTFSHHRFLFFFKEKNTFVGWMDAKKEPPKRTKISSLSACVLSSEKVLKSFSSSSSSSSFYTYISLQNRTQIESFQRRKRRRVEEEKRCL